MTNPNDPALPCAAGPAPTGLTKRELFALAFSLFHGLHPDGAVARADILIESLNKERTQ